MGHKVILIFSLYIFLHSGSLENASYILEIVSYFLIKGRESIQSSTTPDLEHHIGK